MYIPAIDRCVLALNAKYFGLLHYLIQHENKLLSGMRASTTCVLRKRKRMNTNKVIDDNGVWENKTKSVLGCNLWEVVCLKGDNRFIFVTVTVSCALSPFSVYKIGGAVWKVILRKFTLQRLFKFYESSPSHHGQKELSYNVSSEMFSDLISGWVSSFPGLIKALKDMLCRFD